MEAPVNYMISPFEGNINLWYPQGVKIYLQPTKEIDKESDKLDISVFNVKDIINHFLSLGNKYCWGCLEFMVDTGAGANKSFRQVYQIHIADMHHKSNG